MSRIPAPTIIVAVIALMVGALRPSEGAAQPILAPASAQEMEAMYEARIDSARARFSAVDVEFVSGMFHHHAQAITMAEMAPTHGASPTLRTLAARILNSQRDEIATMVRWLENRDQPVPQFGPSVGDARMGTGQGMEMDRDPMHGATEHAEHMAADQHARATGGNSGGFDHDHTTMAGMLSPEQLAELDRARGEEFDRLFLAFMVFHHRGAVTMVEDLFASEVVLQDVELFKLATDIQAEQLAEIDRMNRMLVEMTGSPLGPALLELR